MHNLIERNIDSVIRAGDDSAPIFIVLGMHRSGTSLCASMLNCLGVNIAEDIGVGNGNDRGHFERWDLVEIHDKILNILDRNYYSSKHDFPLPAGWWSDLRLRPLQRELQRKLGDYLRENRYVGFKDPRLCRLLPIWQSVFIEMNLHPHYLICLRNPAHVAESLFVRDKLEKEVGEYRWLLYTADALRHTKNSRRIFVRYNDWFEESAAEAQIDRLMQFVNIPRVVGSSELRQGLFELIDVGSNHSRSSDIVLRRSIIKHYYEQVDRLSRDDEKTISGVDTFNETFSLFQQLLKPFEKIVSAATTEIERNANAVDLLGREKTEAIAQLAAFRADSERFRSEAERLQAEYSAGAEQVQGLRAEADGRHAALNDALVSARAETAEAQQQLAEVQTERDSARDELERRRAEISDKAAQIEQLRAEAGGRHAALNDALISARAETAEARQQLAQVQTERDSARDELERRRAEISDKAAQIEQLRAETEGRHASFADALDAARAETAEAQQQLAQVQTERDSARDELERRRAEISDKAAQIEQLRAEAEGRHASFADALDAARAETAEAQRRLAQFEAERDTPRSEAARRSAETSDRAAQIEELGAEAEEQYASPADAMDATRANVADTERELTLGTER